MDGRARVRVLFRRWRRRSPRHAERRRCLDVLVLLVCGGVLLQAFALEPFRVPTGSMAPTLMGQHRTCACPRCGMAVTVGRPPADRDGLGGARCFLKAFCPNCGMQPLPAETVVETAGDQVLVNKAAFAFRAPRRWEVVVFRLFGMVFIKRVAGLPGETLRLHEGDVYADGRLARKTLAQARAMRVLVFDQRCQPASGWGERWDRRPSAGTDEGTDLFLDGREAVQTLTHRNGPMVDGKYPPLRDEYAYNGGLHPGSAAVHDFSIEADVAVLAGRGTLALRLCDGQDWVEVALPVNAPGPCTTSSWPAPTTRDAAQPAQCKAGPDLRSGQSYHVEMAFVDRRVSLSVNGQVVVADVDLPAPGRRPGVARPAEMAAAGTAVVVRNFRLYRDIHYTRRGSPAADVEAVHLGVEQYFVLGDNSPNSEDSRFWPTDAVTESQMLGPAFLVHLPSQPCRWQCAGRSWQCQLPDLGRMRWLR